MRMESDLCFGLRMGALAGWGAGLITAVIVMVMMGVL